MGIRVRYHVPDEYKEKFRLQRTKRGDWIDLRASKKMNIRAGQIQTIPLGISVELRDGCEAYIAPISSLLLNYGLIGLFGVIDNSFKGDGDVWHLQVYATRDCLIEFGARVAQFRVVDSMRWFRIDEVEELGNPNRGGLGSSSIH